MSGRLLTIETRRTIAWWLLPLMVALPYLFTRDNPLFAWFWSDSSVLVRDAIVFSGPFSAGAAAWMAGRERRRGTEELVATTPRPAWSRQLTLWAATTAWGLLAYLLFGAYVVAATARHDAWGTPILWPMAIGMLAIPAHAALGAALGYALPSRFTPPLVAVGLFVAQIAVGQVRAWFAFLSPFARVDQTVWYGVRPHVGVGQAAFLLGVTGLGLVSLARGERRRAFWGLLVAALLASLAGIALIGQTAPLHGASLQLPAQYGQLIPYTPMCSTGPLPVCVHPAYAPWQAASADVVNRLAAPVLGLPGAPTRAQQVPLGAASPSAEVLGFAINVGDPRQSLDPADYPVVTSDVATRLVWDTTTVYGGPGRANTGAQDAIALWLVGRAEEATPHQHPAGEAPHQHITGSGPAVAAAQRFAALAPAQQQDWLRAHYVALRQGQVRLEELP